MQTHAPRPRGTVKWYGGSAAGFGPAEKKAPPRKEKTQRRCTRTISCGFTLVGQARAARSKEAGPRKLAQRSFKSVEQAAKENTCKRLRQRQAIKQKQKSKQLKEAARRCQKQSKAARSSQKLPAVPEAARSCQKQPKAARSTQKLPEVARSSQKLPEQPEVAEAVLLSACLFVFV